MNAAITDKSTTSTPQTVEKGGNSLEKNDKPLAGFDRNPTNPFRRIVA
jgi:hypothetical protein